MSNIVAIIDQFKSVKSVDELLTIFTALVDKKDYQSLAVLGLAALFVLRTLMGLVQKLTQKRRPPVVANALTGLYAFAKTVRKRKIKFPPCFTRFVPRLDRANLLNREVPWPCTF